MSGIFNQNDLLILFRLIAAHMATEWVFQFGFWQHLKSAEKWLSKRRLLHGIVAGLIAYVFVGGWGAFWLPVAIFLSRVVIDGWRYKQERAVLFLILKHTAYLLIFACCWIALVGVSIKDILAFLGSVTSNIKLWTVGLASITVIWPAGILIGKITEPWRKELEKARLQGLEKAGLWMGRLERILILTFVLLGRYDAIGFLIAAKSILRFSEIRSSKDRKEAEYILIGTMLSFVIAIILGVFTTWVLKTVQPGF